MTKNTNIGENIRFLRKERRLTKINLAEQVGISESHMNKIESGSRRPGINTYQKIMDVLGVEMMIRSMDDTLKGKCITKVEQILRESTDEQALYLTNMLEYMSKNIKQIS